MATPIDREQVLYQLERLMLAAMLDDECEEETIKRCIAAVKLVPTLTPPNEWVSVEETKPEPGERVIATDGAFVGEGYMDCYGVWCRPNGMRWDMLDSEVTHWMPISEPPDRRPPEGEEDSNV